LHLFSQLYLVQNPREQMLTKPDPLWPTVYIPSWLQPGLIPRDPQRGQAFENIAYYGWPQNLVDPLNESKWRNELADMGLHWRIVSRSQWHDYTDTDAVVAIRSFSDKSFGYKPAAKLFNAWHAGVPCVAGPESSFRAERCNELDYLEAKSFDEAVAAMRRLRDDPALRRAMVENGNVRARETSCATMSHRWATILRDVVAPAWQRWRALSPAEQDQLLDRRAATVQTVAAAPQGQQA
ncbi:MAG TPA: glycosyltransferase, partial [Tepidisphaeraceae bacterium]|nr:glycosyltransferase [Tepidisphaeraceae bacterium]